MAGKAPVPLPLLQSFNHNLPYLDRSEAKYEIRTSKTGSTIATIAPLFFCYRSARRYETEADDCLEDNATKQSLLFKLYTPTVFSGCQLESEGDIVTNSGMYNILPCMEVLEHLYRGEWKFYTERTETLNLESHSFDTSNLPAGIKPPNGKSMIRYDLVFKSSSPQGQESKTLAVIEYKATGLIRYSDYRSAILGVNATATQIRKKQERAQKMQLKSFVKQNGFLFTKQANKYANQSQCSHIAVYNWDNLLLHEFSLSQGAETESKQAMLTWVVENGNLREGRIEIARIRKVLLGWLLHAFKAHLGPPAAQTPLTIEERLDGLTIAST